MKKTLIIVVAIVVLVCCLAVARWADGKTAVPTSPAASTTTAPTSRPEPSSPDATPGDIENGLGWG